MKSNPLVASWADDYALFVEALVRNVFVPWGVECEDCGLVAYGEAPSMPCLGCKSDKLIPIYAGRRQELGRE